jgi:hypothetical protein
MALSHHDATTDRVGNLPRGTLRGYFVRYRLALYLFSGAIVASGVALNWNWLTVGGLLPIVAFLPCMLMMFMCMKHGSKTPTEPAAEAIKMLPFRSDKPLDPHQ